MLNKYRRCGGLMLSAGPTMVVPIVSCFSDWFRQDNVNHLPGTRIPYMAHITVYVRDFYV